MTTAIKWIALAIILSVGMITIVWSEKNQLEDKQYDKCLEAMIEAIPDPNDNSRISFLVECVNK